MAAPASQPTRDHAESHALGQKIQKKSDFLKQWSENTEATVKQLKKVAKLELEQHKTAANNKLRIVDALQEISVREGDVFGQVLERVSEQMVKVETLRKIVVQRLTEDVTNKIPALQQALKTQLKDVKARKKQSKAVLSNQKKYTKKLHSTKPSDRANRERTKEDLRNAIHVLNQTEINLDRSLIQHEDLRLSRVHKMLLRYLEANMFYHSQALKTLGEAYQDLHRFDPVPHATMESQLDEFLTVDQADLVADAGNRHLTQVELESLLNNVDQPVYVDRQQPEYVDRHRSTSHDVGYYDEGRPVPRSPRSPRTPRSRSRSRSRTRQSVDGYPDHDDYDNDDYGMYEGRTRRAHSPRPVDRVPSYRSDDGRDRRGTSRSVSFRADEHLDVDYGRRENPRRRSSHYDDDSPPSSPRRTAPPSYGARPSPGHAPVTRVKSGRKSPSSYGSSGSSFRERDHYGSSGAASPSRYSRRG